MSRLLRRSSRRYLLRHPWQFGLSVLGVALGVAVFVSVDLANGSARRSFEISTEVVSGTTTHQIVAGSNGFPEDIYRRLRLDLGLRSAAPVVEGWVGVTGQPSMAVRVLGIDPLAEGVVRPYLAGGAEGAGNFDVLALLAEPATALTTAATADDLGVAVGDQVELLVDGEEKPVRLLAYLEPGRELWESGLRDIVVMDIAAAQELLGMVGRLSRIDLVLANEVDVAGLREALPDRVTLVPAAARADATLEMTRAFRLNLRAMSLLALVCGMFLIYNTMTFSVVQRRGLIGRLRAVGVTRHEVFRLVVGEALGVGLLGTVLGMAGGVALGNVLVRLVTRTINDLYFLLAVRELTISPWSLIGGLVLGVGATVAASLGPAREASRTTPRATMLRSDLEGRSRRALPAVTASGVGIGAVGALIIAWPSTSLVLAFAGLFATLLGAAMLTPAATLGLASIARLPLRRALGVLGNLAARGVAASLSRTAVAVAALMISVAVIVGVGVMVASFRGTLEGWLQYTLDADLYLAPAAVPAGDPDLGLDAELRRELDALPAIDLYRTIRRTRLQTDNGTTLLLVLDAGAEGGSSYRLLEGDPVGAWPSLLGGDAWVSEPYASRTGVGVGSTVTLPTDAGPRTYRVAAVYRSYASDRGAVMLHRAAYERDWQDRGTSGLSVYARPGSDLETLRADLLDVFAGRRQVSIISNRELREQSLAVFDRTFLITSVLRALVTLVAFVGVLSALMAMTLERARELGVLRAIGMTPRQLWVAVTAQTGLLGLISGLVAMPVGVGLGWVMIHVINKRSFGWSLEMQVPPGILAQALGVAVVAALLAGLLPAWRMAQASPAPALREE